ncbi:MAG: hypothetical protein WCH39_26395, partial [Schlesneria sp.]
MHHKMRFVEYVRRFLIARTSRLDRPRRRKNSLPNRILALEARLVPSAVTISSATPVDLNVGSVHKGDTVVIKVSNWDLPDPNDVGENEPLTIMNNAGLTTTFQQNQTGTFNWKATADGETFKAFIQGGDGDESVDVDASASLLRIVTLNDQKDFKISGQPQMPTLVADVVLADGKALGGAQVNWTAQVRFKGTETAHGVADLPLDVVKTTAGGHLVINPGDWGRLQGGTLTLIASTVINGQSVTAKLDGLKITGTNPSPAEVRSALGTDVLRQIAHQESNFQNPFPVVDTKSLDEQVLPEIA